MTMKNFWQGAILTLSMHVAFSFGLEAQDGCDEAALRQAKQEFQTLKDRRRRNTAGVSDQELRMASNRVIAIAEECHSALTGQAAPSGSFIDQGGILLGSSSNAGRLKAGHPSQPDKHVLVGTKWGADSPFAGGTDATGPRSAGGTITYSFMADGVDLSAESAGTNTAIGSVANFQDCWLTEISDAFGIWSAAADILFTPVGDNGAPFDNPAASGDIRIGFHAFDGASGTLAHGYFPPPNGSSAAGDIHFDIAESWLCDPNFGGIDIGIVALHEIGHAIGLNHEATDPAVMEAIYNPALTFGLLADDIIGIGEIYGGSPIGGSFFFGNVGIGTDQPARALDVLGDTATSGIRVTNEATPAATRLLLEMTNNGGAGFEMENTNRTSSWGFFLNNALVPSFSISRLGTGVSEFSFEEDGDLIIRGTLTQLSDRNEKENFAQIDAHEILSRVRQLPILAWNYKADRQTVRHMGPMADEFHELFGLGQDARHIAPSDMSGVTFAAIQALQQLLERSNALIAGQQTEIDRLKEEVAELRSRLSSSSP